VHRFMSNIFQLIEDFDVTPEEFWTAVDYVSQLGKNNEAALLAPGLGMDKYPDIRMDAEDEAAGLAGGTPRTSEGPRVGVGTAAALAGGPPRPVEAPLFVAGAPLCEASARMDDGTDTTSETMLIKGRVTDTEGNPIANAVVDIWHANAHGGYSYFDKSQSDYN